MQENIGPGRPMPGSAMNPMAPARVVGKLDRTEMLEMENLSLKTQNVALQEKQLQQDLIAANKMRQDLQAELGKRKDELAAKYKVDILSPTVRILPDGTILDQSPVQAQGGVPRPPSMPPRPPAPDAPAADPASPVSRVGDQVQVFEPADPTNNGTITTSAVPTDGEQPAANGN